MHKVLLILSFLFFVSSIEASDPTIIGEMPPITVGDTCDTSQSYLWIIYQVTPWEPTDLIASPLALRSPNFWEDKARFLEHRNEIIQNSIVLEDLTLGITGIWQQYFNEDARIFISLKRENHQTIRIVNCTNNIWTIETETVEDHMENSEWLELRSNSFAVNTTNKEEVLTLAVAFINRLNGQPGSDIRPQHSYILFE